MPEWHENSLVAKNGRGTLCTGVNSPTSNGTRTSWDTTDLEVRHRFGLSFTPLTVDLGEYANQKSIVFVGIKENESLVSTTFNLDGRFDGLGGIADFQTFTFPPEFQDLKSLKVLGPGLHLDNLFVETIVPPPLPTIDPPTSVSHIRTLEARKNVFFLVGQDFASSFGFGFASSVSFVGPPSRTLSGVESRWWDSERRVLMHGQGGVLKESTSWGSTELVSLAESQAAGFEISSISSPRRVDGGVLFLGFSYLGNDDFYILRKEGGAIRQVVGPDTALPAVSGTYPPYHFPDFLAARGRSFAFDTTIGPSYNTRALSLFGSFNGGPIRQLSTAGQLIGPAELGSMRSVDGLIFNRDGLLEARLTTTTGAFLVFFGGGNGALMGWRKLDSGPLVIEDVGGVKEGTLWRSATGVEVMVTSKSDEIFRRHGGRWFRVIGRGDTLNGRTIEYMSLRALPLDLPPRMILEVRYVGGSGIFHAEEVGLPTPIDQSPRVRKMEYHPEAGGFFVALDRLTVGESLLMEKSGDLNEWEPAEELDGIAPVSQFFLPREVSNGTMFYRWKGIRR